MPRATLEGTDALILAGGLGTRLRSVLPDRQKVLAEVGGEPVLARLIDFLAGFGIRRIVLAVGHRSAQVAEFVSEHPREGVEIMLSVEPRLLGTGGALRHALPHLRSDPVMVLNGDSFAAADLAALTAFHHARKARVTLLLVPAPGDSRYGVVTTGKDGAVVRFAEKPDESGRQGYISAGIYLFERAVIADIPAGAEISLEREVFPRYCGAGLYGHRQDVPFLDIGTPESLHRAEAFFAAVGARGGRKRGTSGDT